VIVGPVFLPRSNPVKENVAPPENVIPCIEAQVPENVPEARQTVDVAPARALNRALLDQFKFVKCLEDASARP
jgi:hypothetical protein